MRKIIIPLVVLLVLFTGCSTSVPTSSPPTVVVPDVAEVQNDNPNEVQDSEKASKEYEISFISVMSSNPFFLTINAGMQDEAERLGVKVNYLEPATNDMQAQTTVIQAVLVTKPDFVVIAPVDSTSMIAPMQEMKDSGIPMITVDRDINDHSLRIATISSDNASAGYLAAKYLNDQLGGSGNVAYLGFIPGVTSVDERYAGWNDALKNDFPGLNLSGEAFEKSDLQALTAKANALITKDPELKGFFAGYTNATLGAATALQEAGLVDDIVLIGQDASPDEVLSLRAGFIDALIAQKAYDFGVMAVKFAVDYLENGTMPPDVTRMDHIIITIDNIDDPEVQKYTYRSVN